MNSASMLAITSGRAPNMLIGLKRGGDSESMNLLLRESCRQKTNDWVLNSSIRVRNDIKPELELALKEFVLNYQHQTVLSDAILIEKAKLIANGLGVQDALQFSSGWLQKFKERNGIRLRKVEGESASADQVAIANALPLLRDKCAAYPLDRIYNMDETGLFYRWGLHLNPNQISQLIYQFSQFGTWPNIGISAYRRTKEEQGAYLHCPLRKCRWITQAEPLGDWQIRTSPMF